MLTNLRTWISFLNWLRTHRKQLALNPKKIYQIIEVSSLRNKATENSLIESTKLATHFRNLLSKPAEVNLIRVGHNSDGGYLIPRLNYQGGISIGVGKEVSFEMDLYFSKTAISLFDHTIPFSPIIKKLPQNLKFFPLGLGSSDSLKMRTLESISKLSDLNFKENCFLKIDIEGNELNSLQNCNFEPFVTIVIELHNLEKIFYSSDLKKFENLLNNLTLKHHIVNIHVNNWGKLFNVSNVILPEFVEVTLLRSDQISLAQFNEKDEKTFASNYPCRANFPEIWPFI